MEVYLEDYNMQARLLEQNYDEIDHLFSQVKLQINIALLAG